MNLDSNGKFQIFSGAIQAGKKSRWNRFPIQVKKTYNRKNYKPRCYDAMV